MNKQWKLISFVTVIQFLGFSIWRFILLFPSFLDSWNFYPWLGLCSTWKCKALRSSSQEIRPSKPDLAPCQHSQAQSHGPCSSSFLQSHLICSQVFNQQCGFYLLIFQHNEQESLQCSVIVMGWTSILQCYHKLCCCICCQRKFQPWFVLRIPSKSV